MIRKKTLKKLLISILVFLTLFNFLCSVGTPIGIVQAANDISTVESVAETLINSRNNGITGILNWLLRIIVVGIASTFQLETFIVADSAGHGSNTVSIFVTPLDIFFNKFTLTNINIFKTDDLQDSSGAINEDGLVYKIRTNAAMWYYIFRSIALAVLLVMLIYNGIKLLAASLASEKTKYKKMLADWVVCVILVMFIHFIIIAVITLNEIFIGIIEKAAQSADVSNIMDALMTAAFSDNYLIGMASTIVYVMMVVQTIIYLFIYIKRFLTIIFLVIISPIVAVTYSFDRANGGTAKALNGWFREFSYNVFIQTLHCIIYVTMVGVALSALSGTHSISGLEDVGAAIIAIFAMLFIRKAEALLREILGFNKATTLSSHSSVVNSAVNIGMTGTALATGGAGAAVAVANNRFGRNINNNSTNNNNSWISNITNNLPGVRNLTSSLPGMTAPVDRDSNAADSNSEEDTRRLPENSSEGGSADGSNTSDSGAGAEVGALPAAGMIGALLDGDSSKETREALSTLQQTVERSKEEREKSTKVTNTTNDSKERTEFIRDSEDDSDDDSPSSEFEDELKGIEDNFASLLSMKAELDEQQEKLDELSDQLEDGDADTIKENLSNMTPEEAEEYADSLGDTPEGEYARLYLKNQGDQQAYDELDEELDNRRDVMIENARSNGIEISKDDESALLAGGTVALSALERIKKANGISTPKVSSNESTSNESASNEGSLDVVNTTDVPEEEEEEETETVEFPPATLETALNKTTTEREGQDVLDKNKTVRDVTLDNLKLLEIFKGKAIITGNIDDKALTDFNVEILTKLKKGTYRQSNFRAAEARVKAEGDAAVRSLERFKQEPTELNARALTPAGQEYARLMVEAQQAGMIIQSVRTMAQENVEVNVRKNTQTTQTYMPGTNDVLGSLNNRRSAQG